MTSAVNVDPHVVAAALTLTCDTLDSLADVFFSYDGTFHRKADRSVVTATDHQIHHRLATAITAEFPTHELVSEEGLVTTGDGVWRWVIDPIDGTSNFTSGLPFWCVSVALTFHGQVVLGVVDAPALQQRFIARATGGTWKTAGDKQQQVTVRGAVDVFDEAHRQVPLMLTPTTVVAARANKVVLRQRLLGATALDLAYVAAGVAAGSVAVVPHVWDVAAGVLLVQEAGGVVLHEAGVLLPLTAASSVATRQGAVVAAPSETAAWQLAHLTLPRERVAALSLLARHG